MDEPADLELLINRFNRLVKEILQGEVRRTCFQPWEVALLLDLQDCRLTRSRREDVLRRYQRTVQHQLERGEVPPIRFSEFFGQRARKAGIPPPASLASQDPASLNP
jgi:hypothetical protein